MYSVSDVSVADGTCVIDMFHDEGAFFDVATSQDISRAVLRVINTCVRDDQGGYLSGVGTYACSNHYTYHYHVRAPLLLFPH